jgi:hypothetical protein
MREVAAVAESAGTCGEVAALPSAMERSSWSGIATPDGDQHPRDHAASVLI